MENQEKQENLCEKIMKNERTAKIMKTFWIIRKILKLGKAITPYKYKVGFFFYLPTILSLTHLWKHYTQKKGCQNSIPRGVIWLSVIWRP